MRKNILMFVMMLIAFISFSENADKNDQTNDKIQKYQSGKDFGFDFTGGIHGVYAEWSVGIIFPKIKNMITFGLKSVHSTTFVNQTIFDSSGILKDKYTGMAVSGNVWMSGGSPLIYNFVRMYGLAELSFGYSFMPEYINNYGNNFTFGGFGYGGIEFYSGKWSCFFIEAGGGGMYIFGDRDNQYIKDNGHIGSGFAIRAGTRIFIAKKEKDLTK